MNATATSTQAATFALNARPSNITEPANGPAVVSNITLTPVGGYTGAVTLTCAVTDINGNPVNALSIAFSPLTITVPSGSLTSAVSISALPGTWGNDYTATVTGTDTNGVTASTTIDVNVEASFGLSDNPESVVVPALLKPIPPQFPPRQFPQN